MSTLVNYTRFKVEFKYYDRKYEYKQCYLHGLNK